MMNIHLNLFLFLIDFATHKILLDISEVFAVFLQSLLKQVGLRGAPLLHFIPAEDGPTLRHQSCDTSSHVIAVGMESIHSMKLKHKTEKRVVSGLVTVV